jgi:hypothetical protein
LGVAILITDIFRHESEKMKLRNAGVGMKRTDRPSFKKICVSESSSSVGILQGV